MSNQWIHILNTDLYFSILAPTRDDVWAEGYTSKKDLWNFNIFLCDSKEFRFRLCKQVCSSMGAAETANLCHEFSLWVQLFCDCEECSNKNPSLAEPSRKAPTEGMWSAIFGKWALVLIYLEKVHDVTRFTNIFLLYDILNFLSRSTSLPHSVSSLNILQMIINVISYSRK